MAIWISFSKYYLGAWDRAINRTDRYPFPHVYIPSVYILVGKRGYILDNQ